MTKPSTSNAPGWLTGLLLIVFAANLNAQVYTRRFAPATGSNLAGYGVAPGRQISPILTLPAVDATPLLAEDEQQAKAGYPFRFGVSQHVDVDVMQASAKREAAGYLVYQYQIHAPNAYSINLIFDQFRLADGCRVYLYNTDRTMLIGPIDARSNPDNGVYWTDLISGDRLIVELQEPLQSAGRSQLHIASAVHGYKKTLKNFGESGGCEINLACQPDYQYQGDGVALVLLSNGTRWCSGALINDVKQSFRSYFLTAFHCVDEIGDGNGVLSPAETNAAQNWMFRFNYQSPACTPSQDDDVFVTINGATFRSGRSQSDFSLFELTQQAPAVANPTYLGWNRSTSVASSHFGIHHPAGDVKKISFGSGATQISGYGVSGTTHHISFWTSTGGVTEPGSSGSPLFDQDRRIIGQLHGGPSYCGATGTALRDYYGRFATSWDAGGTAATQLKNWLDPSNSSVLTTNSSKPTISGPASFTGSGSFSLNTLDPSIVSWTVAGGVGLVTPVSGVGSIATLTALADASDLIITFTINAGQNYPIQFVRTFSTAVPTGSSGNALTVLAPTYDCLTGAFTFNTSGGDGTPVTYSAIGITGPTLNPNQFVDQALRTAADAPLITLSAMQSGVTATYTWNIRAVCPLTPVVPGSPLTLLPPTYNCSSGSFTFNTSGGDGTPITYFAIGITSPTLNPNQLVDTESRTASDVQPFLLQATQSGVTVSQYWDLKAACGRARLGVAEPVSGLSVSVRGNPVAGGGVEVEIRGADAQPLRVQLSDAQGRLVSEQQIQRASAVERLWLPLNRSAGIHLLQVSTSRERKVVRVLKVE